MALLSASCGPTLHPLPVNPVTDPDVLLQRLADHRAGFTVLSAVARIENYSSRGVIKGRVTILSAMDGRLRVDGWTPTDSLVATLTADPDGFRFFERDGGECLTGPSCPENLGLLLPVGLEVREAAAVLFGIPPVRDVKAGWTVSFDRRVGAYELEADTPGGGVQRLWVREDGVPVAAERIENGERTYHMVASGFEFRGGRPFPTRLGFKTSRHDTDLTVRYRSIDLEPDIIEGDWDFQCPQGVTVRRVRCRVR